jgi:trehalose synthase
MSEVADDPEGTLVLADCLAQRRDLPAPARARVLLVTLPLDDVEENAAMVNAIQRHAQVIVQKSLAEGFGLTVAEGMWKGRPVVGSAVGGILDQIADGTGVLLPDPADLAAFASRSICAPRRKWPRATGCWWPAPGRGCSGCLSSRC